MMYNCVGIHRKKTTKYEYYNIGFNAIVYMVGNCAIDPLGVIGSRFKIIMCTFASQPIVTNYTLLLTTSTFRQM